MAVAEAVRAAPLGALPAPWWRGKRGVARRSSCSAMLVAYFRLEERLGLAGGADLELALAASRPLPDLALGQPQPAAPEHRVPDLQRLRELPRRLRLLADAVLLLPHVVGHDGARHADRPPLRRPQGGARTSCRVRELRRCSVSGTTRVQTFSLMFAAVGISLVVGRAARRPRRTLRRASTAAITPGARRDADHPGLRVSDAGRDSLLGRPGRRGRDHDDLRRPTGDPDHVRSASAASRRTPSRRRPRSARRAGRCSSKVQLPLARRMLLLSVNQTILFALSMVVIAGLIGGAGLGDAVTNGLYTDPAFAIFAGAAIVIMAIALDRSTEAMANRTDPAHAAPDRRRRRSVLRLYTAACARRPSWLAVGARPRLRRGHRLVALDGAGLAARLRPARARLRPEPEHVPLPRSDEPDRRLHRPARDPAAAHLLHRDAVAGDARSGWS